MSLDNDGHKQQWPQKMMAINGDNDDDTITTTTTTKNTNLLSPADAARPMTVEIAMEVKLSL